MKLSEANLSPPTDRAKLAPLRWFNYFPQVYLRGWLSIDGKYTEIYGYSLLS